jgi:ankyrin repeat protein
MHLPVCPNLEQYRTQAKELLAACKAGDPEAVARLAAHRSRSDGPILSDAQLTLAREHGFDSWPKFKRAVELAPELRSAIDPGDPDRVREILEEVPQLANFIPWPDHRPNTPAIEIISSQCVWHRPRKQEIAESLINAGAEYTITLAARSGSVEGVRTLLDSDPDLIDSKDAQGRSALYRAGCVYGQFPEGEAVVDLLLERGAQADIYVAATFAMAERVEALLSEDSSCARGTDPEGMTTLHWALRPRRSEGPEMPLRVTRLLLDAGADVHAVNPTEDDMQAIHHFGEWGASNLEQANLLVEHGADVNAESGIGWTALDYAIDRSRAKMAEHLKSLGGKESGAR